MPMAREADLVCNPRRITEVFLILHEKTNRPSDLEYEYMTGKLVSRISTGDFGAVLTPEGCRRARALGRRLAGVDLTAIYADDFIVPQETARLIAFGMGSERTVPVFKDGRLGESDLSYLTRRRFQQLGRLEAAGDPNATIRDWIEHCPNDFANLVSRHVEAWNEIIRAHVGRKLALVLHVEGFLLCPALLLGLTGDRMTSLHIPRAHPAHVRLFPDRPPLVSFGDESYWIARPKTIFGQYS